MRPAATTIRQPSGQRLVPVWQQLGEWCCCWGLRGCGITEGGDGSSTGIQSRSMQWQLPLQLPVAVSNACTAGNLAYMAVASSWVRVGTHVCQLAVMQVWS
jgi:hypothetical protein